MADRLAHFAATAGSSDFQSIHFRNIELLLSGPCFAVGLRAGVAFEAFKLLGREPTVHELDTLLEAPPGVAEETPHFIEPGESGLCALRRRFPWPTEIPAIVRANEDCHFTRPQTQQTLQRCFSEYHPQLVVEIGSWLGGATRWISDASEAHVIAIDTWLGSEEHQSGTAWDRRHDAHVNVRSLLFYTFTVNCAAYLNKITPLRATSLAGLHEVHCHGLQPGLVFIDGAHDKESVAADLRLTDQLFGKSATIVLDDYATGEPWLQGLDEAVNEFAHEHCYKIEHNVGSCVLLK